ncbi:preprotein translocase subunit SecA [compost metagenome]
MRLFGSERIASLMDKMGLEEGEVIQHSMITKSIERAQKKVEENHFGTRKRLLEYDDVMNSQRTVIYSKRHNALFGERLEVDIDNMIFDTAEELVQQYKEDRNYEGFKLELLRLFAYHTEMDEKEFLDGSGANIVSTVYQQLADHYRRKSEFIGSTAYPVIKDVFETRGEVIENIVVPFSDGVRGVQIPVNLKKAYDTNGAEVVRAFERSVLLYTIDDAWREHLREMDELKQSVQNAVYEQKDPLLVYKFESFNLFKQRLSSINKDVIDFLFKGTIPMNEPEEVREAAPVKRTDLSNLKVSHPEYQDNGGQLPADLAADVAVKQQPVRVDPKIGRNDPCPCGSGKKYKNCHGAGMA